MEPISKTTWDALPGKGKWDSVVALRGPDLKGSDLVKMFTTSVVRHRLSGVMRVGGLVSHVGCVIVPSAALYKTDKFDDQHYFQHVREAANWLEIPIAMSDAATYKAALDSGSVHAAADIFLRAIKEEKMAASKTVITALEAAKQGHY
jgi:hypothetical protein